MRKKLLCALLALCMALSLLPLPVLAAEEITEGPLTFTIEKGKATVKRCSDDVNLREVTIPETVRGVPVAAIGESAFGGCFASKVSFPSSLESIGKWAFRESNLEHADLSRTKLRTITYGAFDYCQSLTEVLLPETLQEIEQESFNYCHELKSLIIPDSVTAIGSSAFFGCEGLEEIQFPASLKTIGPSAFASCASLDQVILPPKLTTISEKAFFYCNHLTAILIPDSVTTIGESAFSFCSSLEEIRIPARLSQIPHDCFRDCSGLKVVLIPGSVTKIATTAFDFCSSLEEVYFNGTEKQFLNTIDLDYVMESSGLVSAQIYLMDGYPDAYYGLYDMPAEDNWAYDGIAFCLDTGLMQGMGNGLFQPNGTTTRAQLVTILWRMCDQPKATKKLPFTDCGISWADPAIAWASENCIVSGLGQGKFGPNMPITREQLVTIFYRFCKEFLELDVSSSQSISAFPDAKSVSSWAKDAMQWGTAVKLISGVASPNGTLLQPNGNATRAQIARIILNFVTNVVPEE